MRMRLIKSLLIVSFIANMLHDVVIPDDLNICNQNSNYSIQSNNYPESRCESNSTLHVFSHFMAISLDNFQPNQNIEQQQLIVFNETLNKYLYVEKLIKPPIA